eukprot:comp23216_c2_seq1/m.37804 comp23216_c2_seq1/g.37804  ORF comp23216_c2_seq1/g.37804 comp23216_c2_seq1/m.37804 type:complete len:1009 (-) comp23216_c2_seq1:257-3283(-)
MATSRSLVLVALLVVLLPLLAAADNFTYPGVQPDQCKNGAQWYLKGACSCIAGFGSDDCSKFDCKHGVYNPVNNTCTCNEGWTGTLCTVCTSDDACLALPGATNDSYCDTSVKMLKKKSYSCIDHDKIIDSILSGTKAYVVAEVERRRVDHNHTFTFSFIRDQKPDGTPMSDLFSCFIFGCSELYDEQDFDNHLMYNCSNITCAMACELGTVDCSTILKGVVEKVSGSTQILCNKAGDCKVNENVLDKLFRGGVHINCTAGECIDRGEVQPTNTTKPTRTPTDDPKKQVEKTLFILYILVGLLLIFILAGLVTFAVVVARNRSSARAFSAQYDERSVNKYLRNLGQFHGSLAWTDLTYDIEISKGFRKGKTLKRCLANVTGVAHPGEVIAIMGPSGSGKSTCLDILSKRDKRGSVGGEVLVDGRPPGKYFKRMSGFVDQEDCLIGTLTVQESLMYSALLRLPDSVPPDVKKKRVQQVMDSLKIGAIANSTIGTAVSRGISGGEKRRVSIAMELVPCPSILFLDEPTSGLDSSNAYIIVDCLARLAREDETIIIMSIHQPRSNIFTLFDKLLLLSKGDMVYFGPADQSLDHFAKVGFQCPNNYNPADYLIDMIVDCEVNKLAASVRTSGDLSAMDNTQDDVQRLRAQHSLDGDVALIGTGKDTDELVAAYRESSMAQMYKDEIEDIVTDKGQASPDDAERELKRAARNMTASWFMQFAILSHRTLNNLVRNPFLIFGHMTTAAVIGVLLGLIYFHTGDKYDAETAQMAKDTGEARNNIINKFINRMASLLLMCAFLAFGSLTSLELFYSERVIYMHERANGFYFPSTYYLQKVLFDIVPLRIIPPMVMGSIAYFMIGLREGVAYFLGFIAILVLVNLCASTICMVVGLTTSRPATGNLIASLIILLSLMLTPIFNNKDSMPPWLAWIHYLSFFYYGYEALAVNELDGQFLSGNVYGDIDASEIDSTEILRKMGLQPENYVMDVSVLFVVSILMLVGGYFILKYYVRQQR